MNKIVVTFFSTFSLLLSSCSTDFNTVAPYKETMVVYGLLNPSDPSGQYIRISKAFLGEGNSMVMAQQKDSINYANVLDVKMERLVNGVATQTYSLQRDTSIEKNSGLFCYPYQVVYKTSGAVLTDGSTYRLIVHNNETGLTVTSTTDVVGDFSIGFIPPAMNFISKIYYSIDMSPATRNGWVYNFTMRFHYKEVVVATNDTTAKYIDWNFGDQVIGNNAPNTITYDHIYRPDLYRIIGSAVTPADTNLVRRIIDPSPIELIYTSASENLYTYQQLVQPSSGLVQERPLFTNITNGIGLFTSRNMKSYFRNMDVNSRAAFDTSRYTRNIHFY
ncbi:MAG: DUF4249 family protein [Bacteroidetes bacterium]|nr:DUF4249 family protein [Bacteroidota bacterium]